LDTVLSFVREAPARGSCKKWARHIYDALMLGRKIPVMKRLYSLGSISFDYMASRDLGPEIIETIAFHFDFFPNGDYLLQFCHSFHGELADVCVDMTGMWQVNMGQFCCKTCETSALPLAVPPKLGHARSSSAVAHFNLPIELVLSGSAYHEGSCALRWEQSIVSRSLLLDFSSESEMKLLDVKVQPENNADASYVEVNGRMVQVCNDIRENYPEDSWANLMSVRVRVGLV
jgi:hypothetical protein